MERVIVPIVKVLVRLYEGTNRKIITLAVVCHKRKIIININRQYDVAAIFPEDLQEHTIVEEESPYVVIHRGAESKKLCGVTINHLRDFIADWRTTGGMKSLLPLLRRTSTLKKQV